MQEQPGPTGASTGRLDLRAEPLTDAERATALRAMEIWAELREASRSGTSGTGCSCSRIG